ncbi:efflux RND transporter permease subunit [Chitinophaga pendula]|uniref:efflux RND transporter permease subunit n=1 Tax=Chitinophaga TaxID=79328 RepID=UPI000BB0817B|nr:efflux RND transporter permease subunit [Chitinophaga pendula]ASZ14113.1 hypothetical protein CK934_25765 [Chitinophaga sp. MD30]
MYKKFIENPVLSTVISVIIVILGLLGLYALPISQYPGIAPPAVEVSALYQGASAEVVMKSVIGPLEEEINGVEHMTYMTSKASNDGTANITINFKQGTDPDMAAINVQNKITKATSQLPAEVLKYGITTTKRLNSEVFSFILLSETGQYDMKFLDNYLKINVIPQIKRVEGVGQAKVYGDMDYSMRIWLKPDIMAVYGLIPADIIAALAEQNIEAAPGKVGENGDQTHQYTLKYTGRLEKPAQFGEIILRTTGNGKVLKLKDVAGIEMGAYNYASISRTQRRPFVYVAINQTAGSNAYEIIKQCEQIMRDAEKDFPKGISYKIYSNANDFLNASVGKLISTFIEAFILVFIVVFIFLQDFRSTLIPAISVPVAIVGTFFFLQLFGFTVNLLTLFALVLAIGIVVDDAIVVVEAVHAKLDAGERSPMKATLDAMGEISTAIISITLVMAAVFVPVTFINGSVGVFYKQFGLTLAVAIIISAINALTLSPALCALFLRPHDKEHYHPKGYMQRFYNAFNTSFHRVTQRYTGVVAFLINRKWLALGSVGVFLLLFWWLVRTTPTGFVPNEDSGMIYGNVILPPATSLERTAEVLDQIDSIAAAMPEMEVTSAVTGFDLISGAGSSYGAIFLRLKPWKERTQDSQHIRQVVARLFERTAGIRGANIIFFPAPTLQGFGNTDGFEFQLQDKTGGSYKDFETVIQGFMKALNSRQEIQYAATPYNTNFPQYEVQVNVAKSKEAGVPVNVILSTLQGYLGGIYASDFNRFGKQYKVMLQAEAAQRLNKDAIEKIYVRNNAGTMAPIAGFITLKKIHGPEFVNRFNLFTSAYVNGSPKPGFSSGDAIKAIQETADKTLPKGYTYAFAGMSLEEISSGSQTMIIFILSLVFIYFLLSAQYQSYLLPFSVLLSLPVGLTGAFLFARLFGLDNNIFLQISLIMLIGLLAKNAILIVEFARMHRLQGETLVQAALAGAMTRLRPILMTSLAFIFGLLPLMLAKGAGALSNRSIGTAAVGGMLIGTVLGVFIIPVLFIIFQSLQEKVSRRSRQRIGGQVIAGMLLLLAVSSCRIGKIYHPQETAQENSYRGQAGTDTVSIADQPWQQLFPDTVLQGLIREGLVHNLDLKIATQRIVAAGAVFRQSKAALLPELNGNLGITRSKLAFPQGFGIIRSSTQYDVALRASWEADIWGKLGAAKRGALAGLLGTEAARKAVQTQLIADIANGYFSLLAMDQQLQVLEQTVVNRREDVKAMASLKTAGVVNGAAVVQSEANQYAAEVAIPALRRQIRETENALCILLNRPSGDIRRQSLAIQIAPATLQAGIPAQLLHHRPDVMQAEYAVRQAFERTNVARAAFYPAFNITAAGGFTSYEWRQWLSADGLFANIAGSLVQPILNRGRNKAALTTAKAQQEESVLAFQRTLLVAGQEVSNALYAYKTAAEQQEIRRKQLRSLEQSVDFTKKLLRYSTATNYIDVLTSEQALLASQLDYVNDQLELWKATIALYRALGGGWK